MHVSSGAVIDLSIYLRSWWIVKRRMRISGVLKTEIVGVGMTEFFLTLWVPIMVVMKAMGMESDQEVVQMVGRDPRYSVLLLPSIEEKASGLKVVSSTPLDLFSVHSGFELGSIGEMRYVVDCYELEMPDSIFECTRGSVEKVATEDASAILPVMDLASQRVMAAAISDGISKGPGEDPAPAMGSRCPPGSVVEEGGITVSSPVEGSASAILAVTTTSLTSEVDFLAASREASTSKSGAPVAGDFQ
ncbi:hypothetical protein FH972_019815 [Carpinus fangiana]|uniref:Uncharacterized protein n=1 Tax=Carpinus fangiana TaxID=176857 RepID=A0A5N6RRB3_9ROSI|nr:hypothetical protein FH972_019815 [Carpinus fangiana]